jgi:hypothetical protein
MVKQFVQWATRDPWASRCFQQKRGDGKTAYKTSSQKASTAPIGEHLACVS